MMQHNRLTPSIRASLYGGLAASALALAACGGGGSGTSSDGDGSGSLSLGITDAPVDSAKSVTVTFKAVTIKPANAEKITISFNSAKQIDLLDLQGDDSDKLLNGESVPAGRYDWIELDVDADDDDDATDSFITLDDGTTHELVLPTKMNNNSGPGLRLVSGFDVPENGSADFTIDFDLRKSVFDPQSGQVDYLLRPALRLIDNSNVGHIAASVDGIQNCPNGADDGPAIYVFNDGDTPDDVDTSDDSDVEPVTTAQLSDGDGDGTYTGKAGFLEAATYNVAFTCEAGNDVNDADDSISFEGESDVPVNDGETASYSYSK